MNQNYEDSGENAGIRVGHINTCVGDTVLLHVGRGVKGDERAPLPPLTVAADRC